MKQRRFPCYRGSIGTSLAIAGSVMTLIMMAGQASAETPSPSPSTHDADAYVCDE